MFVRTDRLFLRPAWLEDAPELARAIGDKTIVRNLARVPWPYREQDARDAIARERHPYLPSLLVTLPDEGGRIVGGIALSDDEGRTSLGYWVARGYHGRGYATEAGRAVLGLARLAGHRCVHSGHFADNPASGRVLRKLGFRPTGTVAQRESKGRGGAVVPSVEYALDLAEADGPQDAPMREAA